MNLYKKLLLCLLLLPFYRELSIAQHKTAPFKDNEVVCFVGNSITQAGDFHHNIFLYYLTRFPEKKIQFYNNGISGDVTGGVLTRMNDDILARKPTTAVIMIGMNDVQRGLYTTNNNPGGDTLQKRARALVVYRHNLDSIVRIFMKNKVRVILQKPSIYDQTAVRPYPNNLGVNDALKICAGYMQELANQYKLDIVDYWTIMSDINQRLQKADPAATIVGADRIHPGPIGHQVMAYEFIHATNISRYVTKLVIKNSLVQSNKQGLKTNILTLARNEDDISFTAKEYALPYPTKAAAALDLVAINDSITCQLLQVDQLKQGRYELQINGVIIGAFTSQQFQQGINLANFNNTPQYVKALGLRKFLDDKYFPAEANWRAVKFIDYKFLPGFANKNDTAAVRKYIYEKTPQLTEYIKTSVNKYVVLKPQENVFLNQLKDLNKEAHSLLVPEVYSYKIHKLN